MAPDGEALPLAAYDLDLEWTGDRTVVTTTVHDPATSERDSSRFENAVQATQERIDSRLETYVAVLFATRGLFAASEYVTRSEFHAFVEQLELDRGPVAVERNGEVVPRAQHPDTVLEPGDVVEIVHFVGGG